MSTPRYPKLAQFLGAYFHQDWPQEHPDSAAVVHAYMKQAKPAALKALSLEVGKLQEEALKEAELKRRFESLGCCLDPVFERKTHKAWLAWLASTLAETKSSKR